MPVMSDLDKILTGLLLSTVTALTAIAYWHHEGYMRIYWVLIVGTVIVTLVALAWNSAVVIAGGKVAEALGLGSDQFAKVRATMDQLQIPNLLFILAFAFWMLYLHILVWLPEILGILRK
jgi:hypothetical protein